MARGIESGKVPFFLLSACASKICKAQKLIISNNSSCELA